MAWWAGGSDVGCALGSRQRDAHHRAPSRPSLPPSPHSLPRHAQPLREDHAYERRIRKARAKHNADAADRLEAARPRHRLDHLVRERYPTLADALRDLDDPLTLAHLFACLPSDERAHLPRRAVAAARARSLEWQAWVVQAHALRKCFISVKGYYFQADVHGTPVTWLVPHALAQVLPPDVDVRVMLTFLELYLTLLRFVLFRLYTSAGAAYPPPADAGLDAAAAGIEAIMRGLAAAGGAGSGPAPAQAGGKAIGAAAARLKKLQAALPSIAAAERGGGGGAGESASDGGDVGAPSLDSGASRSDADSGGEGEEATEGPGAALADGESGDVGTGAPGGRPWGALATHASPCPHPLSPRTPGGAAAGLATGGAALSMLGAPPAPPGAGPASWRVWRVARLERQRATPRSQAGPPGAAPLIPSSWGAPSAHLPRRSYPADGRLPLSLEGLPARPRPAPPTTLPTPARHRPQRCDAPRHRRRPPSRRRGGRVRPPV